MTLRVDGNYDTVVIGTGTAGVTAAHILRESGMKVAIADREPYGGTCALRGCQPKKYLVVNTHLAEETRALHGRGFSQPAVTDWAALQVFKHGFTDPVPAGTAASLRDAGIDTYNAQVRFVNPGTVELLPSGEVLKADKFIIAAGARPRPLDIPGGELCGTSDDFLDLSSLPGSMVFIGGGYISLEFAFIAGLSGSRVTILQKGDRILSQFPPSIVDEIVRTAAPHGISIITGADVTKIEKNGSDGTVSTAGHGTHTAEFVMSAIGRIANVEGLGLETAGVEYGKRGISVDAYMQTTAPGIYAVGDCAATRQLSPVSDMEAKAAAANILSGGSSPVDYEAVPSVIFTYPQMASVGITAEQAGSDGREVISKSGRGESWANYRRLNASPVYYETVVDADTGRILGAHIVGPHAGEQINVFALAVKSGMTADRFRELPWAYPTYTSDVKYMV